MMPDAVYALTADNNRLYAARISGLYGSGDSGKDWESLYDSLNLDEALPTTAVAVNGNTLLAGVAGGILHSVDEGKHWEFRRFPTPAPVISSLLLADVALAGTLEDGLFFSPDGGTTWLPQNYGLLDPCVLALVIMPSGIVFAGTSSGLFRSNSDGRSWQQTSFPPASVSSLAATADGELMIGTENAGLWRSINHTSGWQIAGAETGDAPVNQILVGQDGIRAACDSRLLLSVDDGRSWIIDQTFPEPIIALADDYPASASRWIALGDEIRPYLT